jgi:hypothetical protein
MPDVPTPVPQPHSEQQPAAPAHPPNAGHIPITEEMDSAKWTLPPIMPVLIAAVAIAIVVGLVFFTMRAKPVAAGAITRVAAADQQDSTMVAVQVKLDNKIEKQLWIRNISSEMETADGQKYLDHAAPAGDAARYLAVLPALREAKADPLKEELKVPAGTSYTGYTVFSYPVNKAAFDGRKSLTVRIEMYDQPALVVKQ